MKVCMNGQGRMTKMTHHGESGSFRPLGRFAGSFRPESFRPGFMGGSFRPY